MNHRLPMTRAVKYCRAEMTLSRDLEPGEATMARGFFGCKFMDEPLLHQHLSTGTVYRYPQVQFKVIGARLFIVGLGEGAAIVERLAQVPGVQVGDEELMVTQREVIREDSVLGMSEVIVTYGLATPWLALNEENHRRFLRCGGRPNSGRLTRDQQTILRGALVGNILSLAKGVDFTVPEEIKIREMHVFASECSLKGTPMLGFLGGFSANFRLPPLIGLGKSVSRGFGTVWGL